MAGLEADTTSYNQPLPVSPLEIAGKVGALQAQKLGIDQAKLDQANQALGYMVRAMGALGPNAKKEDYAKAAQNAVDQGLVPQQQENVFLQHLQAAPDSQSFYKQFMSAAMEGQKQIELHTGQNAEKDSGAVQYQGKRDVLTGGFKPTTTLPTQLPPTTQGYDQNNQQVFKGPSGPEGVQAAAPVPVPAPRPRSLPVQPISGPTGPTVDATPSTPTSFDNRFSGAFRAGPSPLFAEGKEAYTKDQLAASARAQAIKPAIQALKLMPGLSTGPGTGQFNDLVAAAKAWGVVDTKAENDPTVLRQELEKKLAQYVGSSPIGQRSDAAQTLAEAGSPNPKKQILPALQALTRDAVALDRVHILKPQAFKGSDYQNYIKHQGTFPGGVDENALTLDMLDDKARNKLVTKMKSDYKDGDGAAKKKAVRFFETLQLAKEAKLYDGE